ncbi:hypothetical protein GCM10010398_45790 [Streptomyces fimbriatus]
MRAGERFVASGAGPAAIRCTACAVRRPRPGRGPGRASPAARGGGVPPRVRCAAGAAPGQRGRPFRLRRGPPWASPGATVGNARRRPRSGPRCCSPPGPRAPRRLPRPGAVLGRPPAERPREAAALTGTAELYRSAGDGITSAFDAHLAAEDRGSPLEATGAFAPAHCLNGRGARAEATADCLHTGGGVAVVTGVIASCGLPGAKGERAGVTVHDRGPATGAASATAGPRPAARPGRRNCRSAWARRRSGGGRGHGRLHGRALAARALSPASSSTAVTR